MSHFTKIQTNLVDGDVVEESLREMNVRFTRGKVKIRGWVGRTAAAEFCIQTRSDFDMGLVKTGSSYDLVADWYGVRGVDQKKFTSDLVHTYAVVSTKRSLVNQGFDLVEEKSEKNGSTRLLLRRMG